MEWTHLQELGGQVVLCGQVWILYGPSLDFTMMRVIHDETILPPSKFN